MKLPDNHPERRVLNDEIHARPPEELVAPQRISFLALFSDWSLRERQWRQVADLAERYGVRPPSAGANHYSADFGPFRLKWERHTEFSRYKFIAPGGESEPFAHPAIELVPEEWLAALLGQVVVATHIAFLPASADPLDYDRVAAQYFKGNVLIGGEVAEGAAVAVTDYRIHTDGFSRILVRDGGLTPRQAGRTIQRLLEIDTYRMMALLALPVARELGVALTDSERDLAGITASLVNAKPEDEPKLLDRLTRLEAEMESRYTENLFRFGASTAYYSLVQRRIEELREVPDGTLQTIQTFLERRLTPAMNTCQAVASRQESLSQRVARASQLLSTRVDITREGQNQAVLGSMNRRAKLQLRLQETVEGLSVAAVTYYVVALVGHIAEGLESAGVKLDPRIVSAVSIPIVALLTWLGVRRIRKIVSREE